MLLSQEFKSIKFDESIKSTLLKNYINFQGRASRADSIWWLIFTIIINMTLTQIDAKYGSVSTIVFFFPGLGLTIRRLHDINKSGWNYLWVLTIIGIFPLIYWTLFKEGDEGNNRFGVSPFSEIINI